MWVFLEKHFEEVLTGVLVMFMASMVFFQVIMRYVFSLPHLLVRRAGNLCHALVGIYLSRMGCEGKSSH